MFRKSTAERTFLTSPSVDRKQTGWNLLWKLTPQGNPSNCAFNFRTEEKSTWKSQSLRHICGPWYHVSLCQHAFVHPLILNAWLPTGHYEISSPLQLSSMSLEVVNVSLLQQAGLTFVSQSSPVPPGSPTVRRQKSRDLKPANPPRWWHLSCDIPPSPIHTGSKAAEKKGAGRAWDQGPLWLRSIWLTKQCNRWRLVSAPGS